MTRPRRRPEQQLQCTVAAFLRLNTTPGLFWTAIGGMAHRNKAAAGISKAMGCRAGVPDMLVIWRGAVLWIELKSATGRVSAAQSEIAGEVAAAGCKWTVAYSLDEVVAAMEGIGVPLRVRMAA